jgi:hypothetical protein
MHPAPHCQGVRATNVVSSGERCLERDFSALPTDGGYCGAKSVLSMQVHSRRPPKRLPRAASPSLRPRCRVCSANSYQCHAFLKEQWKCARVWGVPFFATVQRAEVRSRRRSLTYLDTVASPCTVRPVTVGCALDPLTPLGTAPPRTPSSTVGAHTPCSAGCTDTPSSAASSQEQRVHQYPRPHPARQRLPSAHRKLRRRAL